MSYRLPNPNNNSRGSSTSFASFASFMNRSGLNINGDGYTFSSCAIPLRTHQSYLELDVINQKVLPNISKHITALRDSLSFKDVVFIKSMWDSNRCNRVVSTNFHDNTFDIGQAASVRECYKTVGTDSVELLLGC